MAPEQSSQALQSLVQQFVGRTDATTQKRIVLLQPSQFQGQIWQVALTSQGIAAILEPNPVDPAKLLDQVKEAGVGLPLALILDVSVLNANPYIFCRWCREHYPTVKIILTNANTKEISPPEHHWATYQGAQDLLPGFYSDTLLPGVVASLSRVLTALGWRALQPDPLNVALAPFLTTPKAASPAIASPFNRESPQSPSNLFQGATAPTSSQPISPPVAPKPQPSSEEKPRKTYRGIAY